MLKIMENSMSKDFNSLKKQPVFVIVENERGEVLLHRQADTAEWQLPGGVKVFNEEPGLHLAQLSLYRVFSREDFTSYYSDGDEVFNDSAIYMAKSYFGYLKTKGVGADELRFFSLYDLPLAFHETSKLIVDAYAADHFWIGG